MAEVGNRMARGEMILPFVLQAAEVMKEAVGILEPHFKKDQIVSKGKLIIATVHGDIHDIGKNLVGSILKNQGYSVIDLGKSTPIEDILAAVVREKPDAVGLSALLVTTSNEMGTLARKLHQAGSSVPLIIGGAAVNRQFASRIEIVDGQTKYRGGVHYGRDAFDAVRILEKKSREPVSGAGGNAGTTEIVSSSGATDEEKSDSPMPGPPDVVHEHIVNPMFYGTGEMLTWDSRGLFAEADRRELYKGYWRTGALSDEAFERAVLTEFDPAFEALRDEINNKGIVDARGYYGIWPVYTDNETVHVLDPSDFTTSVTQFTFPRVRRKQGRSIADWLRPEGDCIGIQIVTIGGSLAERSREYFEKEDKYSRGFYLNGIGSYLTELIADKVTAEVRRALYMTDKKQGRRYGFGYPGLPGLEHQKDLLDLLCAEDRLGIVLTEGFQMVPEHSTVTVFVHHKDASFM
jgi:5-methyltetrahydrofolate--homocysteine methyltransferase